MADPLRFRAEQVAERTADETRVPEDALARERAKAEVGRWNRLQATAEIVIATAVVLGIMYYARLPLIVLLVSLLLAFILAPLVDMLERVKIPRSLGALIATVLLLAALYGAFYASYTQAQAFAEELPKYSGEIRKMVVHFRQKAEKLESSTKSVVPGTQGEEKAIQVKPASMWDKLTNDFGTVGEAALIVSFIPFLVYFMLTWQHQARSRTIRLFSKHHREAAHDTLDSISLMIRSFIVGNVLVGFFMGAVGTIIFGLLGVPYFYFVGMISGFLSLVPYLGVLLAAVPPVAAALGHVSSTSIIFILLTVFGLHLFALNVLYPKFLGRRLKLNPLAVTLALLFWGWMWGAMGLVLAVPITGAMKIVFDNVEPLKASGRWLGD